MSATPGAIVRRGGISRTVFIISLIVVGAGSGFTGYFINGVLHPGPSTIILNGAGSTFVQPLMNKITANYSASIPTVQINFQGVGSGAGITDLQKETVDFGASDAPLTNTQISGLPGPALTIPDTIGAVAIAYNIPINSSYSIHSGLYLNTNVTAEIFQGTITKWNDPAIVNLNQGNPNIPSGVNLPPNTITVVHRFESSGTTFVFTSWLYTSPLWHGGPGNKYPSAGVWAPGALASPGNTGVASSIQTVQNTVGYVELDYALSAPAPGMTYAYVSNPNGSANNFIVPTLQTSALAASSLSSLPAGDGNWTSVNLLNSSNGNAYPIVTFSYIMVFKELNVYGSSMNQARAQALVNFLWFLVHDGQNQASPISYVPLPSIAVTNAEQTIRLITYNGNQLHG